MKRLHVCSNKSNIIQRVCWRKSLMRLAAKAARTRRAANATAAARMRSAAVAAMRRRLRPAGTTSLSAALALNARWPSTCRRTKLTRARDASSTIGSARRAVLSAAAAAPERRQPRQMRERKSRARRRRLSSIRRQRRRRQQTRADQRSQFAVVNETSRYEHFIRFQQPFPLLLGRQFFEYG